ncbi:MAG: hypothetical protein QM710_12145 [Flavobacterium sp.]
MKKLLFLLFLFIFSAKSFATAQVPDYLIVGKDTMQIHSNPLEGYFKEHPIKYKEGEVISGSSANWRGYVAFFKFENDKLVVENIYKENYESNKPYFSRLVSMYKDVFGDAKNFPCDFYSGLLICPYGKMLQYVHMAYGSVYEYYRLFEINNGVLSKTKDFMNDEYYQFKRDYFKYFKTTEEYKKQADEMRQILADSNKDFDKMFADDKSRKKENKYLKQKEAEYRTEKQLEQFMFMMSSDYIKTIDIPNKQ